MIFAAKNLRKFDTSFSVGIRSNKASPLILCNANGEISYASNRGDKDSLVASFNEDTDVLMYAWRGEYNTDVFKVSKADLEKHYN